ncbi:MAG: heme ABC exporter ATP-binding protein CcmA [Rickettsiaceae bacterium]|nr:heme ABC exporter ATP-binding protein CcmA [Rickettsiaceae bacterium]
MISFNTLALKIPGKELFQTFSLSVLPSAIIYLHSPNGSGKTSLLRMIAGIQKPSKGNITFGKDKITIDEMPKPYCTYIGHNTALKLDLTVFENIKFWANISGTLELIDAAIHYFQLEELLFCKAYELSAGDRKKVALTRLITCPTQLWLLDEVDVNLDKHNKALLKNLIITKADSGGIIFLTTHNMPEIKTADIINLQEY